MITEYAVKIPNKESFVTKIAFIFKRNAWDDAIIVTAHDLFHALPDDCKLYVVSEEENEEDWSTREVVQECCITIKDLRDLRKKYLNTI